jgi:hypothetical protein
MYKSLAILLFFLNLNYTHANPRLLGNKNITQNMLEKFTQFYSLNKSTIDKLLNPVDVGKFPQKTTLFTLERKQRTFYIIRYSTLVNINREKPRTAYALLLNTKNFLLGKGASKKVYLGIDFTSKNLVAVEVFNKVSLFEENFFWVGQFISKKH